MPLTLFEYVISICRSDILTNFFQGVKKKFQKKQKYLVNIKKNL